MSELESNSLIQKNVSSFSEVDIILKSRRGQLIAKRMLDIFLSLLGLIILLPVFLIIIICIKADSGGPVLFKQVRVGKNGKEFRILKFRTMIVNAENKGLLLTIGKDYRITRIGQILRRLKLDELPQLLNVLSGDMSFVGPRPEVPRYVNIYTDEYKQLLKVKPGITDFASIQFCDENTILGQKEDPEKAYIEEIIPIKFELNMKYIKKISVLCDIKLILLTIYKIIK